MNELNDTPVVDAPEMDPFAEMEAANDMAAEDALAAMGAGNDLEAAGGNKVAVVELKALKVNSAEMLTIFKEINEYMGQMLGSFAELDNYFKSASQVFFNQAAQIQVRKNMPREERNELLINVGLGIATLGIGGMVKSFKTSQALQGIKYQLKQEAGFKLSRLKEMKPVVARGLAAAHKQFNDLDLGTIDGCENVSMPFNNYRAVLYHYTLLLYLIETYEAAQNDQFQGRIKLPTAYDINRLIMRQLLGLCSLPEYGHGMDKEEFNYRVLEQMANNGQDLSHYFVAMLTDMKQATEWRFKSINNHNLRAIVITAIDAQMMALVIHELHPLPAREMEAEFDEDDRLVSASIYQHFLEIGRLAMNHNTTFISQSLLENPTFQGMIDHLSNMEDIHKEWENRQILTMTNLVLFGVLGFCLGMFEFDLAWYWSLLTGVGGLVVGYLFLPITSMQNKYTEKLTHWERTVQQHHKRVAGHEAYVDIAELDSKNKKGWLMVLLFGVIGLIFTPIGAIIGAFIGAAIGFGGQGAEEMEEYDYMKVPGTKAWKAWFMMVILIGANLFLFL